MDSSNSGSFQSSSGGGGGGGGGGDNDEYDSRTQSISSFFNPPTNFNPNLNQLLQPPPPPPPPSSSSYPNHHHHHHRPSPTDNTFYKPSSTQPFSPLGSAWTAPIPPDQTLADFGSYPINPNPSTGRGSDHHRHPIGVTVKNPKKRTRASRRAPTTVLTTDTTNFRQMVQEFTGIPTAPFSTASFSRRLDLFGRGSDGAAGSLHPLRPSAAKVQPPFLNSTANIVESGTSNNTPPAATTSGNYQFAPSTITDFQKHPSTFLDLQNPMFSFQSLLQNSLPQQSNDLSGLQNSSKRWREQNGKLESFEGVIGNSENIGGSKLNSGIENVLVSSRSGGDQVQGNEGSWICPSN